MVARRNGRCNSNGSSSMTRFLCATPACPGWPPALRWSEADEGKMAEEAKARLRERRLPGADAVTACTVHSFCFRVLRQHHRRLGYVRPPTVLHSTRDAARLVAQCLK